MFKKVYKIQIPTFKFQCCYIFVKPLKKYIKIGYQTDVSDRILFFNKFYPFIISCSSTGNSNDAPHNFDSSNPFASVTFIRGTFNIQQLISESLDLYNERVMQDNRDCRFYTKKYFGSVEKSSDKDFPADAVLPVVSKEASNLFLWVIKPF